MTKPANTTPQRTPGRGSTAFWIILVGWMLILGLTAGALYGLVSIYRSNRILAGANALGQDLTGLTTAEAADRLRAAWETRQIVLTTAEQSWTFAPAQLGILLDHGAMAEAAYRQGREALTPEALVPLARRLLAMVNLTPTQPEDEIDPIWRFDAGTATAPLRTIAAQLEIEPVDAGVQVVEGRVEATPPTTGRAVDIASLLATLDQRPWGETLAKPDAPPPRFAVPIVSRPPAVTDVSGIVQELTPLLAKPITINLYDAVRDERTIWTVPAAEMGRWLDFNTDPQGTLSWTVGDAKIAKYVEKQNNSFGDERYVNPDTFVPALADAFKNRQPEIHLRVSHGEREHVVQAGETLSSIATSYGMPYPWLLIANPGSGDSIFVGDRLKIPSQDKSLPLPVIENKRIKISIKNQRMQAYENGQVKWDWILSTGIPSSPTSPGVFQIQTHEPMAYAGQWDLYMPWFMGIYRPVPNQDFMNGFHGFPSRDRVQLLWTRNLGHPVTYGCILLSTDNAKLLYDWAEAGIVVEITA